MGTGESGHRSSRTLSTEPFPLILSFLIANHLVITKVSLKPRSFNSEAISYEPLAEGMPDMFASGILIP